MYSSFSIKTETRIDRVGASLAIESLKCQRELLREFKKYKTCTHNYTACRFL